MHKLKKTEVDVLWPHPDMAAWCRDPEETQYYIDILHVDSVNIDFFTVLAIG